MKIKSSIFVVFLTSIIINAQPKIVNKYIDSPILFNDDKTYIYFKNFEQKMIKKNKYIPTKNLDIYAVFINKGLITKPYQISTNDILFRSKSGNNVIFLPNNSKKSKRKLYKVLKRLYKKQKKVVLLRPHPSR